METKRLFFGFEVLSPWPEQFPPGRLLKESDRHLTLAFLGEAHLPKLESLLVDFPKPPFSIGLAGKFDRFLSLPQVAAWHVKWLEREEEFLSYQKQLVQWLNKKGFPLKEREEFLAHVTLARKPFEAAAWREAFEKLPLFLGNLHLCESLGNSRYEVCWAHSIFPPFEEKEHTADVAFVVRGSDYAELFLHAALALSFHFPPMVDFLSEEEVKSGEEVVEKLNRLIAIVDEKIGVPFKAVSYHGAVEKGAFLEWEMIVDV